jgi:hypothetical protein
MCAHAARGKRKWPKVTPSRAGIDQQPCPLQAVQDIAGQSLAIGDRVATLTPRYRYKLSLGRVMKFTPKGLKVRLDNPRWVGDDHMVQLDVGQVVKVPGP